MRKTVAALFGLVIATFAAGADDFKPEPGFEMLFADATFDGWKTKKGDSLDGKSDAFGGRFKLHEGTLTIDPNVKGDVIIESKRELRGDLHLQFDFRPDAKCNNDLFIRGLKFDLKKADVKNLKVGEWNTFEILITGDQAEFRCNGESLKKQKVKTPASPLGIRAEFGSIEIRRLRVKSQP